MTREEFEKKFGAPYFISTYARGEVFDYFLTKLKEEKQALLDRVTLEKNGGCEGYNYYDAIDDLEQLKSELRKEIEDES